MPDDGNRYEIVDGELLVSKQPHVYHQEVCANVVVALGIWNDRSGLGAISVAPGLIFSDDQDVAPDVVWISLERRSMILGADGKFHGAPDLVIEVLSPGSTNERRDREAKLKLYSSRGVFEYWILDWKLHQVEVYRRDDTHHLALDCTLNDGNTLTSPLLEGFSRQISELFKAIPVSP
jgi:Uma2 family endonuclease